MNTRLSFEHWKRLYYDDNHPSVVAFMAANTPAGDPARWAYDNMNMSPGWERRATAAAWRAQPRNGRR